MPMASKSWLTHQAALMLLVITWSGGMHCNGLTVDPPENLVILDPGHLGHLEITWSLPASLINMTECQKLYQLEYFNTYRDSWTAIRTTRRTYSAQFDLMKDVRVRVYTLLGGSCVNGTMIKSTSYTELVQKPPGTGVPGTAVKDFVCVYHNMKYMECNWGRSPQTPDNSQQNLFFWYKELQEAEECPKYIISSGVRSGCNFTGIPLPDFTDVNFCVNGSSPKGLLQPTFISLQIQNHVKPETAEKLHLRTSPDMQLELHWDHPVSRVPAHCLEWEVEYSQEGPDGNISSEQILTKQTSLTLPFSDIERHCFRVRSKLQKYCADQSFWSEWSHPTCHPATDVAMCWSFRGQDEESSSIQASEEKKEVIPVPEWDLVPVYLCVTVAIITILVLSVCVGAVLKVKRSRQVEKQDSLLNTLFARNSVLQAAVA